MNVQTCQLKDAGSYVRMLMSFFADISLFDGLLV